MVKNFSYVKYELSIVTLTIPPFGPWYLEKIHGKISGNHSFSRNRNRFLLLDVPNGKETINARLYLWPSMAPAPKCNMLLANCHGTNWLHFLFPYGLPERCYSDLHCCCHTWWCWWRGCQKLWPCYPVGGMAWPFLWQAHIPATINIP